MVDWKQCARCNVRKAADQFNKDASRPDGLQGYCRPCHRAASKEWRQANPAKRRRQLRRYEIRHAERRAAQKKRWYATNPGAHRAHGVVERALRSGALIRPDCCERCRNDELRLHAHHSDYEQPLKVEWLCSSCHRQEHNEESAA